MTKENLISDLIAAGYKSKAFNSNNAWGFGGGIGHRYTLGKTTVSIFTAHFRHLDPVSVVTVSVGGKRLLDINQNAENFELVHDRLIKRIVRR